MPRKKLKWLSRNSGLRQLWLTWVPRGKWLSPCALLSSLLQSKVRVLSCPTGELSAPKHSESPRCSFQALATWSWREKRNILKMTENLEGHPASFIHSFIHSFPRVTKSAGSGTALKRFLVHKGINVLSVPQHTTYTSSYMCCNHGRHFGSPVTLSLILW